MRRGLLLLFLRILDLSVKSFSFPTGGNIVLQAVSPGSHQSLGSPGRIHGLLRGIIEQLIGNQKLNSINNRGWG